MPKVDFTDKEFAAVTAARGARRLRNNPAIEITLELNGRQ
jgi:hypothetical protein